jgi:hypothetical protein
VVDVVIHALNANNERISTLARLLAGRASQEELREITDAVLADVRQSSEAAHARHFDALEGLQQLEARLGGRLEAASAASADAFVALEASVLQRVTEVRHVMLCYGAPSTARQLCRRQLGVAASCDIRPWEARLTSVYSMRSSPSRFLNPRFLSKIALCIILSFF